jgi:hypothetical protein
MGRTPWIRQVAPHWNEDLLDKWKAWQWEEYAYGFHLPESSASRVGLCAFGEMGSAQAGPAAELLVLQASNKRAAQVLAGVLEVTMLSNTRQ